MGALIQTKGTRFLANFFNSKFSVANMPIMRAFNGGSLVNDSPMAIHCWIFPTSM